MLTAEHCCGRARRAIECRTGSSASSALPMWSGPRLRLPTTREQWAPPCRRTQDRAPTAPPLTGPPRPVNSVASHGSIERLTVTSTGDFLEPPGARAPFAGSRRPPAMAHRPPGGHVHRHGGAAVHAGARTDRRAGPSRVRQRRRGHLVRTRSRDLRRAGPAGRGARTRVHGRRRQRRVHRVLADRGRHARLGDVRHPGITRSTATQYSRPERSAW